MARGSKVKHPHILPIQHFDVAEMEGETIYFFTMDFLEGRDLAKWQRARQGSVTLTDTVILSLQICEALQEAHQHQIVHRDLKPANIFLSAEGRVKLMDFGVSRFNSSARYTQPNSIVGTPAYMSPEQWQGDKKLDHRSDLYSLGAVIYELTTDRVPFEADSITEMMRQHVATPPPSPTRYRPDLPESLKRIILTCLEKAPSKRFSSAERLGTALREFAVSEAELLLAEEPALPEEVVSEFRASLSRGSLPSEPITLPWGFWRRAIPVLYRMKRHGWSLLAGSVGILASIVLVSRLVSLDSPGSGNRTATTIATSSVTTSSIRDTGPLTGTGSVASTSSVTTSSVVAVRPPTTSAAASGTLVISANPGTEIYIDGELRGTVPPVVEVRLPAGEHRIRYSIPDYDSFETVVEVPRGGAPLTVSHHFPAFGVLRVNSTPYANLTLDGKSLGYTPVSINRLREGRYAMELVREGYHTISETILIRPGEVNRFSYQLVPDRPPR